MKDFPPQSIDKKEKLFGTNFWILHHSRESKAAQTQQIKHGHQSNVERVTASGASLLIHYHTL